MSDSSDGLPLVRYRVDERTATVGRVSEGRLECGMHGARSEQDTGERRGKYRGGSALLWQGLANQGMDVSLSSLCSDLE